MYIGGAEEDRTPDLRIANATLSQLSYGPPADGKCNSTAELKSTPRVHLHRAVSIDRDATQGSDESQDTRRKSTCDRRHSLQLLPGDAWNRCGRAWRLFLGSNGQVYASQRGRELHLAGKARVTYLVRLSFLEKLKFIILRRR